MIASKNKQKRMDNFFLPGDKKSKSSTVNIHRRRIEEGMMMGYIKLVSVELDGSVLFF